MRTVQHSVVCLLAVIIVSTGVRAGYGQVTVQQPVISSFGGNFAVSVPDRGSILLGSISRAGESRSSYGGPFRAGSSVGRFSQHSSLSSNVYIHDLREMDRMVLDAAETGRPTPLAEDSSISRRAMTAWGVSTPLRPAYREDDFLQTRQPAIADGGLRPRSNYTVRSQLTDHRVDRGIPSANAFRTRSSLTNSSPDRTSSTSNRLVLGSRALDPNRAYRLGHEAEASGRISIARLHYQVAAQNGSVEARHRLRELDRSSTGPTTHEVFAREVSARNGSIDRSSFAPPAVE